MKFNDLDLTTKEELNIKINEYANSMEVLIFFFK